MIFEGNSCADDNEDAVLQVKFYDDDAMLVKDDDTSMLVKYDDVARLAKYEDDNAAEKTKMKRRMERKSPRRRKSLRDGWALVFLAVDSSPPPQEPNCR